MKASDEQLEMLARQLCRADGMDPDIKVRHAFGDDFTAQDWERNWKTDVEVTSVPVVSPLWRLYRARAQVEMSRHARSIEYDDVVVPFRRPK